MSRGFTLIEVMISAMLLGLIGVVLMTTLNSSLDVKDRVNTISNRNHLIRQALARMTREISMAYLSSHRNVNFTVIDTKFIGEKSSLTFVAFGGVVHKRNVKESDQREIDYFISQDPKTGESSLMRREKANPGRMLVREGRAQVLCPNVSKLSFKYWGEKNKKWETEWKTDNAILTTLPRRVQIELEVGLEGDVQEKFITEAEIRVVDPVLIK